MSLFCFRNFLELLKTGKVMQIFSDSFPTIFLNDEYFQENFVALGGVLNTTLFNTGINSVKEYVLE